MPKPTKPKAPRVKRGVSLPWDIYAGAAKRARSRGLGFSAHVSSVLAEDLRKVEVAS